MKFSTKSRYALRLMAELARYAPGTTVSLKEISERQNLSLKYLEQIVTPLARVGLVKSGPHPLPCQRDLRVPYVRAVLHPAVLGRAGRGHQPVHRQRHSGAAGPEPARRQGRLLRLQHQDLKIYA